MGPPPPWLPTTWAAHVLLGDEAAALSVVLLVAATATLFIMSQLAFDALRQRYEAATRSWASVREASKLYRSLVRLNHQHGIAGDVQAAGTDGALWVGTDGGGLARLDKNGRWQTYSTAITKGGRPNDHVWALAPGAASDRALDYLVAHRAPTLGNDPRFPHDPATQGWGWTSKTFGWVEPTARGLLGLRVLRPAA